MLAVLTGEVVDLDANEWDFNGKQGIAYGAFVQGSKRDQPQRVRLTEKQFTHAAIGDRVEWPVNIVALESNFGAPRLRVTLDQDFDISATDAVGRRAAPVSEPAF